MNNLTKSGQQLQNMFASFIEVCIIHIKTLSGYVAGRQILEFEFWYFLSLV